LTFKVASSEQEVTDKIILNHFSSVNEFVEFIEREEYYDVDEMEKYIFT